MGNDKLLFDIKRSIPVKTHGCKVCITHRIYNSNKLNILRSELNISIIYDILGLEKFTKNESSRDNLNKVKDMIEKYPDRWDTHIKLNDFSNYKIGSKIPPISRSYFKMVDILHQFSRYMSTERCGSSNKQELNRLHLCEAPGGFIQACNEFFGDSTYTTISLESKDKLVPNFPKSSKMDSMNKRFYINKLNILKIEDSNITKISVINELIRMKYNSYNLITADGGIPVTDYSNQEKTCSKLIISEVYAALHLLKAKGVFVLKLFDTFTISSMTLINIIAILFEKVYIYKPTASRSTNSEKYLIAISYYRPDDLWKYTNYILMNMMFTPSKTIKSMVYSMDFDHLTNKHHPHIEKLSCINNIMAMNQAINILNCIDLLDSK